jgi:hypothetical protein
MRPSTLWLIAVLAASSCAEADRPLAVGYHSEAIDILFMIDTGASNTAEQLQLGEAFQPFLARLAEGYGTDFHVGVVTNGIQSEGCPKCDDTITGSCMNLTGEGGRLQDRLGKNIGTEDAPVYDYHTDPACRRITTSANPGCFYDAAPTSPNYQYGIALTGINSCGYERGLEAVRRALGEHVNGYNAGFLRLDATLLVVVISDEEDCGNVGDVKENLPNVSGNICYYAAKGTDPENKTVDPDGKALRLTPVSDYFEFLKGLKGSRQGMVKFAGIVGMTDEATPGVTEIRYQFNNATGKWDIVTACQTAGCTGKYCYALPGTRYIQLAQMFGLGENGFLSSVCQRDYTAVMERIAEVATCPGKFYLKWKPASLAGAQLAINGTPIPADNWTYEGPTTDAPNGAIVFVEGYNVCSLVEPGEFKITLANL